MCPTNDFCALYFVGISWVTLHVLDHLSFTRPHRIYIPLPLAARSIRTQIRWWQYGVTTQRPFWALDNVLIGGLEINPAQMQEMLNNNDFDIDNWEFHPNGEVVNEFCDRKGRALAWQKGSDVRHATTRQLIMQKNYMIHFKVNTFNMLKKMCVLTTVTRRHLSGIALSDRYSLPTISTEYN